MLSGGERAKLALAVFECENGNFLILDEPTNHLDLPARESLETALKNFDGTVLFVSHDRYFIRALAGKILELEDGNATEYNCNYEEYHAKKVAMKETQKSVQPIPASSVSTNSDKKSGYYRTKEDRAADARKKTRVKKIEEEIASLETEDAEINASLSDPAVTGNFALLTEKCNRLEAIKTKLDELYAEYETLID